MLSAMRFRLCLALALALFGTDLVTAEQPYTSWREYGGSVDSMQYSALAQVNQTNVASLKLAWFFPIPAQPAHLPFNPLIIDKTMYVAGAHNEVMALEAATGRQLWVSTNSRAPDRGIAYWESQDRKSRRLVIQEQNGLREIDARTGEPIASFGTDGYVDMRFGNGKPGGGPFRTPARVFKNLLLIGSNTGEGYGSSPGELRAFDAESGKLVWSFQTIPRPGEFGYDTYKNTNAWKYVGGANCWGEISVDEKNGIVFFPTGSPTYDLYGADRVGDNLFGNCLIALDALTGKRLWHFQAVHHDLWDYDLGSAPKLLTIQRDGKSIDIVAQAGKTGFLYVLERLTGKPVWPIEEKAVPRSEIPGEAAALTQPFPTIPPPFSRQRFSVDDVNPYLHPMEQQEIRAAVRAAANEGIFTPPNLQRYQIEIPGTWGGANWGGLAADPRRGLLFVRNIELPSYRKMALVGQGSGARAQGEVSPNNPGLAHYQLLCANCHGPGQISMRSPARIGSTNFLALLRQGRNEMPPFPEQVLPGARVAELEAYLVSLSVGSDADEPLRLPQRPNHYSGPPIRYSGNFAAFWHASNGLPTIGPPWSELVAYDLNTGAIKWRVPDGTSPALAAQGIKKTGSVRPRNGPVVTAGGLVFIANSQDGFLRAYDEENGSTLWEHALDANPEGIPSVYEIDGREYIAFAAGAAPGTDGEASRVNPFLRKPGKLEAQGYYVFTLP